jgi:hypothetical protein
MSSLRDSRPRVAVKDFNPLHDPDTRAVVFSFLGAGQGALIKTVSKACKATYEQLGSYEVTVWEGQSFHESRELTCTPSTTLLSAALASPAKLRLAIEWNLRLRQHDDVSFEAVLATEPRTTGRLADYDTLLAAEAEIVDLELNGYTLIGAAASGDVQKIARLHTERDCELSSFYGSDALNWAASGGSVEAMRWLRQQGCVYDTSVYTNAAYYGHLNVLHFLHEDGYTVADVTGQDLRYPCEFAARRGHLEVLRWLREHGWPWGGVCTQALYGSSVPVMQYLKEQGFVFNEQTMIDAVDGGHLHMCQYLRTVEGCPWSAAACTAAAAAGRKHDFEVLRWLHESGCPWDVDAVNLAAIARFRSIEMLEYLWAEGAVPDAAVQTRMLSKACAHDDFTTAQWLREHGAQWPDAITASMCRAWCAALHLCLHCCTCCDVCRRLCT